MFQINVRANKGKLVHILACSSMAEHPAVNRRVAGSSPAMSVSIKESDYKMMIAILRFFRPAVYKEEKRKIK